MKNMPAWLAPLLLSPLGLLIPIAPRSGPLIVFLLGIGGIVHYFRHRPSLDWLKTKPIAALAAFLAYLLVSGLWSEVPERSFEQALRLIALAFFGLAGFSLIRSLNEAQKQRLAVCLVPALIVGIVTGCIYGLLQYTGSYIRILTDFLGVNAEFSNFRSHDNGLHIAKTMLLANLAFFALLPWLWQKQKIIAVGAFAALLVVCFYSDSQTSLVACLTGGSIFFALKLLPSRAPVIILAAIVASFVLAVPATQSSYLEQVGTAAKNTLGRSTSPETRLQIYHIFGTLVLNKPVLGHGLMAGVKYESSSQSTEYHGIHQSIRTPHNMHLQMIFDLGFIGVTLLLLAFFWPIWRFIKTDRPNLAMSLLLPLCVMIAGTAFNFVIWRTWIPSAAVLSVFFILLSLRNSHHKN